MDDQKLAQALLLSLETVKMFRDLINKQEKLTQKQQDVLDNTLMRSMVLVEHILIEFTKVVIEKLKHNCECK
jgi:hypothetical protein